MSARGSVSSGDARGGTAHWWAQRVTSIALLPLTLWLVISLVTLTGADQATVTAWLRQPLAAVLMAITVATVLYHALLGLEVVIDDYVHAPGVRITTLVLVRFACVFLGVAGVFAVLRIAFSG